MALEKQELSVRRKLSVVIFVPSQNHTTSCEFLKIPCVHPECGVLVKKADLTDHLEKECMYRLEKCRHCQRQINLNRMKVNTSRY